MKRLLSGAFPPVLVLLLASCETVGYYGQAMSGQATLLFQRQPIHRVLDSPDTSEATREALELVVEARAFARNELMMEVQGSYSGYVELDRDHVVWNVFAAPEFSLLPRRWCYPLAGCVSYRGYFSQHAAERYAARLEARGYDVYVGGVDAYSTLGWFDDPLLSSSIHRPPHRLVALLFHELAHQQVYVAGDTAFNESFASYVEREGLRQWLLARDDETVFQRFVAEQHRHSEFVALVEQYSDRFEALYASDRPEEAKREEKRQLQEAMREAYAVLRSEWEVDAYGGWFAGPLNNAQLATVGSYNGWVPAFKQLMTESGGDWSRFYRAVERLADQSPEARQQALQRLQRDAASL